MNVSSKIKAFVVIVVSYSTALLFVYAAVSKLIDFENFQVQLGQSPLLSAFAKYASFAVPLFEIVISILLLVVKWRILGLFLSYCLMIMFTSYIYIILNYSSFTPCSCGGILEELSWNQHMIFNLFFVILSMIGIYFTQSGFFIFKDAVSKSISILSGGILSCSLIYFLFISSERIIHYHNNFVRRFPHFPAVLVKEVQLSSENFYFAGAGINTIYLGDYTAPLKVIEVNANGNMRRSTVRIDRKNLPFTSIQLKVKPPNFFLVDGNVPAIFKGNIEDWNAKYAMKGESYFSIIEPVDSMTLIFRATLRTTRTNTLGRINLNDTVKLIFKPQLIQKQIDGVFDTDGQLMYDGFSNKIVYLYTYRNEYIVADKDLKLLHRGNTLDTITKAKLKVVTVESNGETKLASPPLTVNKSSAVFKGVLFVNSQLAGQYENLGMWEKASIIDVYDFDNKAYLLSFYILNTAHKKLKSFYVQGNYLYALVQDKLIIYKLRESVTENYKSSK